MTYKCRRPQLSCCFAEEREERGGEISSLWAAEPPTPALDQSMLLHLQAMSGPARSAAHWRSTEEHIMLPTAAPSLFILPFFFFLMQLLLFSCFCFLYKISSKEVWWARTLCFWVECLTPGQSDSNEDSVPPVASLQLLFLLSSFFEDT